MGFLSNILGAVVKTAIIPIAIAKDVVNVVIDEKPDAVEELIESAGDDIKKATDDLADGEVI